MMTIWPKEDSKREWKPAETRATVSQPAVDRAPKLKPKPKLGLKL